MRRCTPSPGAVRRHLRGWAVSLAAILAFGCGDGAGPEGNGITLRVRVHVLQEPDVAPLNTTLSDDEVASLFAGANVIWAQTEIRWEIESIVREAALNGAAYAAALSGQTAFTGNLIASTLPRGQLLSGGWDVFILRDFGGLVGGIYLGGIPAVVTAELDPTGARDIEGSGARILAHELGHSLTLLHVPCTPDGNLMAPGCNAQDRTRLTTVQIEAARAWARSGRPFGS